MTEGPAPSRPPTLAAPIPEHSAPSAAPLPEVVVHHVPLPKVDSHTVSMLQHFAVDASQTGYNDGSLAADLLSLAENKSLEGLADALRHVPLQRMSLAGQFVSDAISDPFITDELRSRHESVRFPVVKSALADATVFTAASHPINSLVNDLMLKSATSRLTGNVEARMAVERLEQVLVQFDLAPEFVREAMLTQQPIDEAQIQRFLEMKREEAEVRRQAVLNECRRLVSREVERQTFARNITPATLKFLKTIWGPLLMKRLLRDGGDADGWKQGLQLMERLVDEVEMRALEEGSSPEWREMMLLLREALIAEGMSPERAGETLVGMQQRPPPAL
ncbi:MAG TPA: DUF1631 family protein [Solimonas sp.]|nr:DUF1631 family protein [Solimonas sp.]